ncbi:hypothetical protein KPA96_08105 [Burkholderia cenocepacia]|uniref:hypothetical protein n=1 Tax=Burkholderia cenocepacia TaxID=95486 RepID=UPI0028627C96|nr:hypothetical protein [Burkholderia cenocepacia]MDR8075619.1 hypothetical protein [Burkholderia cenocepacia]
MDIDELLTVEERKDDWKLKDWIDGRRTMRRRVFARDQRHIACRRAGSLRCRTGRAGFAVHVARERN